MGGCSSARSDRTADERSPLRIARRGYFMGGWNRGFRSRFPISVRINAEELSRYDLSSLPHTIAEIISHASESCQLVPGDLVALTVIEPSKELDKEDEIQVVSEKLGALTTRIV